MWIYFLKNIKVCKMKNKNILTDGFKLTMLLILISVIFSSCENKFESIPKYQRPDWLVGKLYTQINNSPELSMFAQCMVDIGYDKLVDKSGTYTAFVPSNVAFQEYLGTNSYLSIEDIPLEEKERIVKSHIIQLPYSAEQLTGLSASGWVNEDGFNSEPLAFKRQTLMKNANRTYPIKIEKDGSYRYVVIVDESEAEGERTVHTDSRKYVPLFYDGFLSASELNGSDYMFYFDRTYESGVIFYAGAKVISDELYADNGVIYSVDKVIEPLLNAEELMDVNGYTAFKELIYQYSDFNFNLEATLNQEGAEEGLLVDSLYNLNYNNIGFDIQKEVILNNSLNLEYHLGIAVPNNSAVEDYINTEFLGEGRWDNFDNIPSYTKRLFINAHISQEPIFLTDINTGFNNELGDFIFIDESHIIKKTFGSNCTFIGLDEVIQPKAFTSVSSPLYVSSEFETFFTAYLSTSLLAFLKNDQIEFSLFLIDDNSIGQESNGGDESLIMDWLGSRKEEYKFTVFDHGEGKYIDGLDDNVLEMNMLGHTGVQTVLDVANMEFVETLDGRHIILDHENNTLTGGNTSYLGYNGAEPKIIQFEEIGSYDNGQAFKINGWLNFSNTLSYTLISANPTFLNLLIKAGLADEFSLKFLQPSEKYTMFIPSDDEIASAGLDTLPVEELRKVLGYHILKDEYLFTDGRQDPGYFQTLNSDKLMYIDPKPDMLSIIMSDDLVFDVSQDSEKTNIIGIRSGENGYPLTEIVIHKIDKVLY